MKIKTNAAIENIGLIFTVVHPNVVVVLETLDLNADTLLDTALCQTSNA